MTKPTAGDQIQAMLHAETPKDFDTAIVNEITVSTSMGRFRGVVFRYNGKPRISVIDEASGSDRRMTVDDAQALVDLHSFLVESVSRNATAGD